MTKSEKNIFLYFLKAIVSAVLIWYLLSNTKFSEIFASLRSSDHGWIILSFITLFIGKILTSYRWQVLLKAQDIKIPLRSLIASVFVGQFFNSILPSTVGGDAYRAYDTASESKETAKSIVSLIADRLIGVFALAFLAVVALGVGIVIGEDVRFYAPPVIMVFLICTFAMTIVFNDQIFLLTKRILTKVKLSKISIKLDNTYKSLYSLRDKPKVLLAAFFISILLQANVILFYYFIGVALDLSVSILFFSMVVPVASVVLLVPFSINGIGIREGIFVFLLTGLGVASHEAIALSWISFGLMLTQGIIGGGIFALRGIELRKPITEPKISHEPPKR